MALRVHMLAEPEPDLLGSLKPLLVKGVTLTCGPVIPDPADYHVLISGVPDRGAVEGSSNLKVLIIPWAGLPEKTRDLMQNYPDIHVHNIHHNALPAAEMAVTLMLAVAKDLIPIDRKLRKGDWSKRYNPSSAGIIAGGDALVLGYGAIGREIASRCVGLGMTVRAIATGRDGARDPGIKVYGPAELHDLLPLIDVLFLSLPLTPETKELIGAKELSLLRDGAIMVNISRGGITDEEALYTHLKRGRLRAGLDVWYNYPREAESRTNTLPSAFAFHDLPNVVMTPHLAGHSDRTEHLRARELARLLNLAAEGRPLPNRVDLRAGY